MSLSQQPQQELKRLLELLDNLIANHKEVGPEVTAAENAALQELKAAGIDYKKPGESFTAANIFNVLKPKSTPEIDRLLKNTQVNQQLRLFQTPGFDIPDPANQENVPVRANQNVAQAAWNPGEPGAPSITAPNPGGANQEPGKFISTQFKNYTNSESDKLKLALAHRLAHKYAPPKPRPY